MSQSPSLKRKTGHRSANFVVFMCFVTIVADGYDLIVYGSTVPAILAYKEWAIAPDQAGVIGSVALMGMLIGALTVGAVTDIWGRRKIMLICIAWFSICMLITSLAPNAEVFAIMRFVAGLGLGGVVPTAIALTVEYSPKNRRQFNNALMYSGYFVGGILTALLALALLPATDFRVMYAIGAFPLVTVLPVAWRYLPESIVFLTAKGRHEEARVLAEQYGIAPRDLEPPHLPKPEKAVPDRLAGIRTLFHARYFAGTMLFAAASFCGLLLVYGLNTWLPNIMKTAGYGLGSSLSFLLVLNCGAIIGTVIVSKVADKVGVKPVAIAGFIAATGSVFALSANLPAAWLFAAVAVAGLGTGSQILVNGFVATYYPDTSRATALGWSLGMGRIGAILGPAIGGVVAASTLGYQWSFYVFSGFALLGALFIAFVPRRPAEIDSPLQHTHP